MNFKAPGRPRARTATQITDARRSRREGPDDRLVAAGQLTARWTQAASGRLVLEWSLARARHQLINRTRGSNA